MAFRHSLNPRANQRNKNRQTPYNRDSGTLEKIIRARSNNHSGTSGYGSSSSANSVEQNSNYSNNSQGHHGQGQNYNQNQNQNFPPPQNQNFGQHQGQGFSQNQNYGQGQSQGQGQGYQNRQNQNGQNQNSGPNRYQNGQSQNQRGRPSNRGNRSGRSQSYAQVANVTINPDTPISEWARAVDAGFLNDYQGHDLLNNLLAYHKNGQDETQGLFMINLYNKPLEHLQSQLGKYGVRENDYRVDRSVVNNQGVTQVQRIELIGSTERKIFCFWVALNFCSNALDNHSFWGTADAAPIVAESFTPNLAVGRNNLKWVLTLPTIADFANFLVRHQDRHRTFVSTNIWAALKAYKAKIVADGKIDEGFYMIVSDVPSSRYQHFHLANEANKYMKASPKQEEALRKVVEARRWGLYTTKFHMYSHRGTTVEDASREKVHPRLFALQLPIELRFQQSPEQLATEILDERKANREQLKQATLPTTIVELERRKNSDQTMSPTELRDGSATANEFRSLLSGLPKNLQEAGQYLKVANDLKKKVDTLERKVDVHDKKLADQDNLNNDIKAALASLGSRMLASDSYMSMHAQGKLNTPEGAEVKKAMAAFMPKHNANTLHNAQVNRASVETRISEGRQAIPKMLDHSKLELTDAIFELQPAEMLRVYQDVPAGFHDIKIDEVTRQLNKLKHSKQYVYKNLKIHHNIRTHRFPATPQLNPIPTPETSAQVPVQLNPDHQLTPLRPKNKGQKTMKDYVQWQKLCEETSSFGNSKCNQVN